MTISENQHEPIQIELTVSAWQTAKEQLASLSKLSEQEVADAASKGALWRKRHGMHKLRRFRNIDAGVDPGDQLFLNYDASVLAQSPMTPSLISDQLNYSIWNKPAGMLSQGSKWSDHCTITETVRQIHAKPAYLVHRLDKAASGLIVVAHTKNALKKLADLFAAREVEKHYTVQVHGRCGFELPYRIDSTIEDKVAITDILQSSYDENTQISRLLVKIETGRKHQIRHHLSAVALPVVGDRLFDKQREHSTDLQLVASRLAFVCPFTSAKRVFEL